jgi:hypothetical protein
MNIINNVDRLLFAVLRIVSCQHEVMGSFNGTQYLVVA